MKRLLLLALLICPLPSLFAQFESAAVLGSVRDTTDSLVAGAKVTLTNLDTGITANKETGENGTYEFINVKIGRYSVIAEKSGFATASASGFTVNVNARQRVDLTMTVGQVAESLNVSANVSLVESDSSERGQVIEQRKIVELPLDGRNYSDLALLSTGVRRSSYAVANPPREGSFNVNGQRSTFNNFLLDGVDNNAYGTSNQGFSNQVVNLPPDAITEFRIVTNNMSAEYGRTSGAMINASMRSGTNQYHGSLWEFLRNTDLNAVGYFKPARNVKPVLQRNQFGATIGGPIVKDRAFFFADYEGFRENFKFLTFSTLPTAAQRQGIFSKTITNPLTGEVFPAGTPIPQTAWSSFARKVIGDLPLPTNAGAANNYERLRKDTNHTDKMDAKLDGQISSRITAFIRASHRKTNIFQEPEIPGPSGGGGNGFIRILNQQLAFGTTWTINPRSLLEFRMGFSKTRAGKEPRDLGGPGMLATYGIPGLPDDNPRIAGGLTNQNVGGYTGFGRQATNPQWQHPFVWDPKLVYSYILGRHSLKAGYEYQRVHTEVQDVNPLFGGDVYSAAFSGDNVADFLFGLRSGFGLTNFFVANYRQVLQSGYLQDDFKVNSKLTLNLGVRYEYATPQWEKENRLTNFNPLTNVMDQAKSGSIEDRALVRPDRNNFAPRIGFAYSITPSFVVRSGYGISYIHFNRAGGGNLLAINFPQVVTTTIAQQPSQSTFRTTQQGYPAGITSPVGYDQRLANITYLPRNTPTGYVQNWFFSLQKEVFKDTVVDIGYVGNRSNHLLVFGDFNQAAPTPFGQASIPLQARRPNQAWGPITAAFPGGFANYHALQVKFERRYSAGLSLLNSFTYSKAIDNAAQSLEDQGNGNRPSPQNFYNLKGEKGVSGYDQTFNNTTSAVYELPVGKGRRFAAGMPAVADAIFGGWQISGIHTATSGEPINLWYSSVSAAFQTSNIGADFRGQPTLRPNLSGNPVTPAGQRTIDNYLDRAIVTIPTTGPFGNVGRNTARSNSFYQLDANLQKNFRIRELATVQFRSEFFNLLNKTNFRAANPDRSSGGFGTIRTSYPARQIQFAVKILF